MELDFLILATVSNPASAPFLSLKFRRFLVPPQFSYSSFMLSVVLNKMDIFFSMRLHLVLLKEAAQGLGSL